MARTIDKIITKVDCKYGAPMGRASYDERPIIGEFQDGSKIVDARATIFDCYVPMSSDGAYDRGGAYWGIGPRLRVRYTKDLKYVQFYREGKEIPQ